MKMFVFPTRRSWRAWLEKHHAIAKEAWVLFCKKRVQKRSLKYEEAVEEALCFGWIDGMLRRIDDRKHILRFSPRKMGSLWAPSNIARARKLIREKKMAEAGLRLFRGAKLEAQTAPTVQTAMQKSGRIVIPSDLRRAFAARPKALMHFQNYPPSFRLLAIHWITSAKKVETRIRRVRDVVSNAARHAKPV